MNDYYAALGVPETATVEEISAAYRQLALRYHPDRQPGNAAATEIFERATEAFEVLSDPELRLRYDRTCLPQSPANRRRPPATWPFVKEGSEASWAEVMQRRRPPRSRRSQSVLSWLGTAFTTEWPSPGQRQRHAQMVPWAPHCSLPGG